MLWRCSGQTNIIAQNTGHSTVYKYLALPLPWTGGLIMPRSAYDTTGVPRHPIPTSTNGVPKDTQATRGPSPHPKIIPAFITAKTELKRQEAFNAGPDPQTHHGHDLHKKAGYDALYYEYNRSGPER